MPAGGIDSSADLLQAETAYLAGGAFWSLEAIFRRLPGVIAATSGFGGGSTANPTYLDVCNGKTGHSEIVKVKFDPVKISYRQLLDIFFEAHDPTRFNATFDVGTQYRSVIFYTDENQKEIAIFSKSQAQRHFANPIVTTIQPFRNFYKADERHQNYYEKNAGAPYCQIIVAPRLQALENRGIIPKKSDTDFFRRPKAA